MQDIYTYGEFNSDTEKQNFDLIRDKAELSVDEQDMVSVKKAELLRKLII